MSTPKIEPLAPCGVCDGCKLRKTIVDHLDNIVRPYFEPLVLVAEEEYARRLAFAKTLPGGTRDDRNALDALRSTLRRLQNSWQEAIDRTFTSKLYMLSMCDRVGIVLRDDMVRSDD